MPFVAGQSGNPNGRPKKGFSFTDIFEKELRKKTDINGKKITYKELLVRRAINEAIRGDLKAIQFCVERLEGKPITTSTGTFDFTSGGKRLETMTTEEIASYIVTTLSMIENKNDSIT